MTHFLERQKERFLVLSWCRALCPFIFPKLQMYNSNVQVKVNILQVTSTSSFQRSERNKRMSERALTHPLCPTLWLHGLQPARLLCPWDFPGKDTGVGCHFLLQSKRAPRNTRSKRRKDKGSSEKTAVCGRSLQPQGGFPKFLPVWIISPSEIKRHLLLGRKVTTNLDSIFKSQSITLPTKVSLVKAVVFPVVMYGCESWTVKTAECWRIDAFELWCWRRLLRVPWTTRRSNQSLLKEISPGCSLEGLMLKLKL